MDDTTHAPRWPFVVALCLVLFVAAGLRLYHLPELPLGLHYDEAANVILAGEITRGVSTPIFISSYTGKEVLFFYWVALWMKLLGISPLALRLSAALVGLATVAATVWATRELLHNQRHANWIALLAAAFLATSFWHLVLSRYGFRAVTQPLMQALTVAALWRGLRAPYPHPHPLPFPPLCGGKGRGAGEGLGGYLWLSLAGLFCGLTAYTYLAARAFPIPLAAAWLTLIIADRGRRRVRLIQLAIFFAAAALTLAPLAAYWWTHPGSFLTRADQVAAASWAEAWAGFRTSLGMFFIRGDPSIRFNLPHRPLFDPVTAALFLLGIVALIAVKRANESASQRIAPPLLRASAALLATRVFLLVSLLVMLLPAALTVNDIVPNNLRSVGLLPFVYVFPALGLWIVVSQVDKWASLQVCKSSLQVCEPANHKSQIWSFVIVHCSLVVLLLTILTPITAIAYFRHWASSAPLYDAADGDLANVAHYLNETDLSGMTPYVASVHYRHPTLAALARDYGAIRWLTGGRTVVFPAQGDALLIFPRSASDDLAWVESVLPDAALVAAPGLSGVEGPPGPDGAPAFRVYRVSATASLTPTHPANADLGHVAAVLGTDVVGEPRSGATVEVAVWWRVLNTPDRPDYGPVARLADRWGFVWGETEPFHYPGEEWTPGEVVVDHLTIPVAAGAPPGDYTVRFSLYSAQGNSSLPVLDDAGRYAGTYVELPLRLERAAAPAAPADLGIRTELDARVDRLTLLGFNLDTTDLRPGERLYLTLFWRADEAPLSDDGVTLSLGDTALYAGAPVHGTYPTSAWTSGEVVADRYDPRLPRGMPAGEYPLLVGRVDNPSYKVNLGTVTVQAVARTFDVPPISHPLTATLGNRVELLGYDLSAESAAPGEPLTLTLYWQALAEMDENYTVFAHLVAPDGSMTGQQDNQPLGGAYPTSLWLAGEVVADTYAIPIRPGAASGAHRLEVGMYVAETGARLPVAGGAGDSIVLQTVAVNGP